MQLPDLDKVAPTLQWEEHTEMLGEFNDDFDRAMESIETLAHVQARIDAQDFFTARRHSGDSQPTQQAR